MRDEVKKGETKMDSKTRFEFAKFVATNTQEQIKLADSKAVWVFSVLGLLTAVLTNVLTKFNFAELMKPKVMIFGGVAIISLIIAFKHIILVIYPRLTQGNKEGVIYFRDILASTKEEYSQRAMAINEETMIKKMYEQSHALASISEKKFSSLRIAIISCMFALGWIAVTAIMLANH
ncbi:MAG: Pycsar system effector family protein [Nanoarchaeota archaeon]